jgi:two-component system response regulator HydG
MATPKLPVSPGAGGSSEARLNSSASPRTVAIDAGLIGFSRRVLIAELGLLATKRFILRLGYAQGWRSAMNGRSNDREPSSGLAAVGQLLDRLGLSEPCDVNDTTEQSVLAIARSCEAEEHRREFGRVDAPVCWFLAGYVSGHLSRQTGLAVVCREEQCLAVEHDHCRFRIEVSRDTAVDLSLTDPFDIAASAHLLSAVAPDEPPDAAQAAPLSVDADPGDIGLGMRSPRMRAVMDHARRAAQVESTVLITGESGVGKERLARFIHEHSPRVRGPFVPVNCGALPDTLIESELFGHRRGAFTGATEDRAGLFEAAHGGSIFLDEIGELRLDLQVKLLRVLQEREVRRVGDVRSRPVDVRVITATNRDLLADVQSKRFRQDLYYRLAVLAFHVPPLRERDDDLRALVDVLLAKAQRRLRRPRLGLTPRARAFLLAYHWPGNIRELENAIESASAFAATLDIDVSDLPAYVQRPVAPVAALGEPVRPLWEMERDYILAVLRRNRGNRTHAAEQLRIGSKTLYRKLRRYAPRDGTARQEPERDDS